MTLVDEESELKDLEPEQKRKKIEDSLGRSVASDIPEGKVKLTFFFPYSYEVKILHPSI